MKKYLTIHGHFYQPPRENPWTESIDEQPTAYPEHDWNERINAECYFPNGFSRILDHTNRITEIVNNYKYINFNFGPTLLSWLETHAPMVYQRILQADREGAAQNNGHGPAIAQAYNHVILPLAPEDDRRTQIEWALADFRHRFQREPESIWLPETAINQTTLNLLIEYRFKYIILSPHQALRIRPLQGDENAWHGVENGSIDTRRAYRCFARGEHGEKQPDHFIDIFFYNGELARGISFEHLLYDAKKLAARIEQAFGEGEGNLLVNVATDGETYGHHERFGDMALAYLLHVEAGAREIRPSTYAAFLEENPPQFEVELKPGPDGEGTAWSCAHGVGRWYRDCGCQTGGEIGWNQQWRQPLRAALDHLRDEIHKWTFAKGAEIFRDYLEARNDYIHVILERTEDAINSFVERNTGQPLSPEKRDLAIALMEIERQLQLMYTSCGWFFTEISGLETVQILKYAARAIQITEYISDRNFEDRFIQDLEKAKSNIAEYQHGAWIFQHKVKPNVISFSKVINHTAMTMSLGVLNAQAAKQKIYIYEISQLDRVEGKNAHQKVVIGKMKVNSSITLRKETFGYALFSPDGEENIKCFVKSLNGGWNYEAARQRLLQHIESNSADISTLLQQEWQGDVYSLVDIFYEERQRAVETIVRKQMKDIITCADDIFKKSYSTIATISRLGLPLPEVLAQPARFTLSHIIHEEIARLQRGQDSAKYQKAVDAAKTAEKLGIPLNTEKAAIIFQNILEKRLLEVQQDFTLSTVENLARFIELADKLMFKLHNTPIQNRLFEILKTRVSPAIDHVLQSAADEQLYSAINGLLRIAYRYNFNIKIYRDRLKSFEQAKSQNPGIWP